MTAQIAYRNEAHRVSFRLELRSILRKPKVVPTREWSDQATEMSMRPIAYLLGLTEDDSSGALLADDHVSLPHEQIAALSERLARELNLPEPVPFILDLQHAGRIDAPTFGFHVQWRDMGQRPLMGWRREGAFLTAGSRTYRIPNPQFTIVVSAEEFNAAPMDARDARLAFWGRMRELLPEDTRESIQVTGYLRETRVAYATRFSLALKRSGDGIRMDPVLFGHNSSADDEEALHEVEGVLPPAQQKVFSQQRFLAHAEARSRYALDAGWYLVLSEDVRKALGVVRRAQNADETTRWAFARNPRSFLRKALGDDLTEETLSSIFIETFEYSQRIQGEGLWEKMVLPWIKKSPEEWLPPEEFGLRVGDRVVPISANEISDVLESVETALKQGEAAIRFGDHVIPATQEAVDSLQALIRVAKPGVNGSCDALTSQDENQRHVLMISTHHDTVEFKRPIVPRRSTATDDVAALIKTNLKPHQVEGLQWLQSAWKAGLPGVLLADDMGLGKTLQALVFVAWMQNFLG